VRGVQFTHPGGPTVLIDVEGWRLLTDPAFGAPGRRYSFGRGRRVSQTRQAGEAVLPHQTRKA
jgi:hypothetical protein